MMKRMIINKLKSSTLGGTAIELMKYNVFVVKNIK